MIKLILREFKAEVEILDFINRGLEADRSRDKVDKETRFRQEGSSFSGGSCRVRVLNTDPVP